MKFFKKTMKINQILLGLSVFMIFSAGSLLADSIERSSDVIARNHEQCFAQAVSMASARAHEGIPSGKSIDSIALENAGLLKSMPPIFRYKVYVGGDFEELEFFILVDSKGCAELR